MPQTLFLRISHRSTTETTPAAFTHPYNEHSGIFPSGNLATGSDRLFVGPIFTREAMITPRRMRFYVARTAYVAILLILMCTAWLVLAGAQRVRDLGDLARFGMILFQILAPLQLVVAILFVGPAGASAVAQEKDRRTLILLLLTHLTNSELVLGRLMASLLNVLVLLTAALPLFALTTLLGGISAGQILRVFAVTLASVLVCGSLGSTIALWREKTFQSLALTVLAMVLWLAAGQIVASGSLGGSWGRHCDRDLGRRAESLAGDPRIDEALRPARPGAGLGSHADQSLPAGFHRPGAGAQWDRHGHGADLEPVAGRAAGQPRGRDLAPAEHLGRRIRCDASESANGDHRGRCRQYGPPLRPGEGRGEGNCLGTENRNTVLAISPSP